MNRVVIKDSAEVVGKEALAQPKGTVLLVTKAPNSSNMEDIIIRTSRDDVPFVCLKTGDCWGAQIESYSFKVIKEPITIYND